jgi:hypothetical protein
MFTIEEAKAARQATTLKIPTGASREFGREVIKRAVEEQAVAAEAETLRGLRRTVALVWKKLKGNEALPAALEEPTN